MKKIQTKRYIILISQKNKALWIIMIYDTTWPYCYARYIASNVSSYQRQRLQTYFSSNFDLGQVTLGHGDITLSGHWLLCATWALTSPTLQNYGMNKNRGMDGRTLLKHGDDTILQNIVLVGITLKINHVKFQW